MCVAASQNCYLVQVLHLLGDLAPETSDPARFVRFIYNRIVLENATVRAAATAALAAICARCEPLRDRIVTILRRSLADNDDEVRVHFDVRWPTCVSSFVAMSSRCSDQGSYLQSTLCHALPCWVHVRHIPRRSRCTYATAACCVQ